MQKKVIVISSTPRKGGNSDILADAFIKGSSEVGHIAEKINIRDINLKFCEGCFACQKSKDNLCPIKDDMSSYLPRLQNADVLVFATPVYFFDMCGQLKTFLDRLNPLYPRQNKFTDIYLLATAAEAETNTMEGTIKGVSGWIECFKQSSLRGVVGALGVTDVGDINKTDYIDKAYELGKNI